MKRNIYGGLMLAASALLCLAGCKKDEEGEKIMLGTQFEKAVSAQKTYLGENNTVCWSTGDSVWVNGVKCKGISSDGIEVTEASHYYAVYPATDGNNVDLSVGTVIIPATQTYNEVDGKQQLSGPMAARLDSKNGRLYFKNLYSLLKVTVAVDDKVFTVKSIMVTATGDHAKALAGSYGFSFSGATTESAESAPTVNAYAKTDKDSSTTVTLSCSSNNTVTANSDKDFYLVVHPLTTAQKLTVKVFGLLEGRKVIYTYNTLSPRTLNRSSIGGLGINLQQLNPVIGALPGEFSVSATKKVQFSQGNLQYKASTNTWRFAANQYDYVGNATYGTVYEGGVKCNNENISSSYTGWIDLFGWGTSGQEHGATCYQPWESDGDNSKYYAYNDATKNLYDSPGTADWGYNAISNGGNTVNSGWRTLKNDEWGYLLDRRTVNGGTGENYSYKRTTLTLTDGTTTVYGLLVAPDNFTGSLSSSTSWNDWHNTLEPAGVVFLSAAGGRNNGTTPYGINQQCLYWSGNYQNNTDSYNIWFSSGGFSSTDNDDRNYGHSVRLVLNVPSSK